MPFKVVKCKKDNGDVEIEAIPSYWEKDGISYWPRKNSKLLIKDENSRPTTKWVPHKCLLLKNGIKTRKQAQKERDLILNLNNTEEENEYCGGNSKDSQNHQLFKDYNKEMTANKETNKRVHKNDKNQGKKGKKIKFNDDDSDVEPPAAPADLKDAAVSLLEQKNDSESEEFQEESEDEQADPDTTISDEDIIEEEQSSKQGKGQSSKQGKGQSSKQGKGQSSKKQTKEISTLSVSLENNRILKQVALILQDIRKDQTKINANDKQVESAPPSPLKGFPLGTVQELEQLNADLKTEAYYDKFMHHMVKIGGESGRHKASDVAPKVIRAICTTEVISRYSWTGLSRSNYLKKPFKKLEKLVNTIQEIVNKADNTYDTVLNEKYLRDKLLKHGNKYHELQKKKNE